MSLRDNWRNSIFKKNEKQEEQSDYEKEEAIDNLKSNEQIKNNFPLISILDNYKQYPYIYFGAKNASSNIYQTFHISNDEVIVVYLKGKISSLGFPSEKAVITNKELYVLPSVAGCKQFMAADDKTTYHYPISDFCKYIIYTTNNRYNFENIDGVFTLIKSPIIAAALSKNIAEESFCNIIKDIQANLYINSEKAKNNRENLFQWLKVLATTQILEGNLKSHTKELIQIINKEPAFKCRGNLLLFLEPIYFCNIQGIINYIRQFSMEMNANDKEVFLEKFSNTLTEFIQNLQNVDSFQNTKYLEKIKIPPNFFTKSESIPILLDNSDFEKNILKIYNQYYHIINIYLAIRKYPDTSLTDISDFIKKHNIDNDTLQYILKFVFTIRDQRMLSVFNNINNHEKTFHNEWLSYSDSLGLTPLHYSLILKNDAATDYIITRLNKLTPLPKDINEELKTLYNYAVLCILTGKEKYLVEIAEYYMDEDVKPLITNKHLLEMILKAKEFAYNQSTNTIRTLETNIRDSQHSGNYDDSRIEEIRIKIEQLCNFRQELKEMISNTKSDIREIDDTIKKCMFLKYSKICEQLMQKNTLGNKLFYEIYMSPDILYSCISSTPEERELVYIYNTQFCINKNVLHFDNHKNPNNNTATGDKQKKTSNFTDVNNEKEEKIIKPYGNKWFSDAAYNDMHILRKEYHILAKKYHPDNYTNQNATKIFMDIESERSLILAKFK